MEKYLIQNKLFQIESSTCCFELYISVSGLSNFPQMPAIFFFKAPSCLLLNQYNNIFSLELVSKRKVVIFLVQDYVI